MDLMFIDVDCAEDLGRYSNAVLRIAKKIVLSKLYAKAPTITIGKNVTLIFDGGCISGDFKLVGNKTSIQAPIAQIFDGVTVEGDWICDRAYPQWFDGEAGKQPWITDIKDADGQLTDPHDCSPAINKAIKMKKIGEVFLPMGHYYVARRIEMTHGIRLIGEGCGRKTNNETYGNRDDWGYATRIVPYVNSAGADGFPDGAVLELNIKRTLVQKPSTLNVAAESSTNEDDTWSMRFPDPTSTIQNVVFSNDYNRTINGVDARLTLSSKVCCLVAGGFLFENVYWNNFRRAIKVTHDYADIKTVRHCVFSSDLDYLTSNLPASLEDKQYMIDLGYSGDALVFENCAVHSIPKKEGVSDGALRLNSCKGGSISSNILNRDVLLHGITNVVFAGNHMEVGAQLRIVNSDLAVNNNYFERGRRPSVVFDISDETHGENVETPWNGHFSVINMTGNTFIEWFKKAAEDNVFGRPGIKEVSDYDLALCSQGEAPYEIHLARNYRYVYLTDVESPDRSNHPTGIIIGKYVTSTGEIVPVDEFNKYSHILSAESTIRSNLGIAKSEAYSSIPQLSAYVFSNVRMINLDDTPDGVPALISGWKFSYYGEVILDPVRDIRSPKFNFSYGEYNKQYGNIISLKRVTGDKPCMLRITRVNATGKKQYVDVPVCGGRLLYDNYYCVNGYKWQDNTAGMDADPHPTTAVEFKDRNVVCAKGSLPSSNEGWVKGDIIINNGETSTATMWYFNGTKWIAR